MMPLVLSLLFIALLTLLMGRYSFRQRHESAPTAPKPAADCDACTITSALCSTQCLTREAADEAIYFDDEELDRFRHRPSDGYTDEETDEFADILHTMREEEVTQWLQSIRQREIALPDQLKEEVAFYLQG